MGLKSQNQAIITQFWVCQVEQWGLVVEGGCWLLFVLPNSHSHLLVPCSCSLNLPALVHAPSALVCTPQLLFIPYPCSYSHTHALLLSLQLCSCISWCCHCCLMYMCPLSPLLMQQLLLPLLLLPCICAPSYHPHC